MLYRYAMTNGASVDIITNKPLTLEQLQGLVGGYIEMVRGDYYGVPAGQALACNEDGLSQGLALNPAFPRIVGNCVVGQEELTNEGVQFVGLGE